LEQARDAADRQKAQKQSRKKDGSSSDLLARSLQFSSIVLPTKASKKIVSAKQIDIITQIDQCVMYSMSMTLKSTALPLLPLDPCLLLEVLIKRLNYSMQKLEP
jgi:hypothetical protein